MTIIIVKFWDSNKVNRNLPGVQIIVAVASNFGHKNSMLSRTFSAAVNGIDAYAVEVEVNCGFVETFIALVGFNIQAI